MPRLRLLAAIVAGAALMVPAASAHAALETVIQDDASLLHRAPAEVRASLQKLRSLGVDRVRLTANWSVLTREPDSARRPDFDARDPRAYPQAVWDALDDAVRLADEEGVKVMIDIGFWAPRWATTARPGPRARTNIDAAHFADFAVAVARRYSGTYTPPRVVAPPPPPSKDQTLLDVLLGGSTTAPDPPFINPPVPLPAVDQFVLWNEPNHPSLLLPQWKGKGAKAKPASPAIYARMVRAAYAAVKPLRPDASLLLGNTSSDGGTAPRGAVAPLLFLRELACVDGKLRPLKTRACRKYKRLLGDGWAHHPYPRQLRPDNSADVEKPDNVRVGSLTRLSKLLRRLSAKGRISKRLRNIHITEFGYETEKIAGRPKLTEAQQARYLTWAEFLSSRVRGVVSFAQFLLRDLPPGPVRVSTSKARGFGQYYSGLQTVEGKDKLAVSSFTAGLFAHRPRPDRVLLWGRLRLGAGPKSISVERKRGRGKWRLIKTRTVDGRATFSFTVRYAPRARYRLLSPRADGSTQTGLPVKPVQPYKPPRPAVVP